jgi:abortive infection bacteriophage resistance protein
MLYSKPALSYSQQLTLLTGRGLDCSDHTRTIEWLQRIGYYRLSAYFIPFRTAGSEVFKTGANFDQIVELYKFDSSLRLLVLQALDRIEVGVRAIITYHLAHELGPFGHTIPTNFAPNYDHVSLMRILTKEETRSTEVFVRHYRGKYTTERHLPIWMATELLTFGVLSKMHENLRKSIRKKISREFSQPESVFTSWLHSLAATRNICAHHSRLWNRTLAVKPELPAAWAATGIDNSRVYVIALVIQSLLSTLSPDSKWKERLKTTFTTYPAVDLQAMRFPANWQTQAPWL